MSHRPRTYALGGGRHEAGERALFRSVPVQEEAPPLGEGQARIIEAEADDTATPADTSGFVTGRGVIAGAVGTLPTAILLNADIQRSAHQLTWSYLRRATECPRS
jgi:hypothetical protein